MPLLACSKAHWVWSISHSLALRSCRLFVDIGICHDASVAQSLAMWAPSISAIRPRHIFSIPKEPTPISSLLPNPWPSFLFSLPLVPRLGFHPSHLQPSILHHPLNFSPCLRHCTRQLFRKDLTKPFERLLFPIQHRIAPLHQLHKLSCIDIWIAATVNVV
jgi:hypothetical protein